MIGGGSSYTPELMEGLLAIRQVVPIREVQLVDVAAGQEKLEIVGALARRMAAAAGADWRIDLTLNRRAALQGADFVITQLRVGQLAARIRDEKIPLRYGIIGQETTGPGGFAKAQRTIPVLLEICRDIEAVAPGAWLINFTNPAGMVTEAVLNHTKVKALGLCNVPLSMRHGAASVLGVEATRVDIDYIGLNHLVWGRAVYLDGEDVTRHFLQKLQEGPAPTVRNIADLQWDAEFLAALGLFPCPYHRYYYAPAAMLAEEQANAAAKGTRGEQVQAVEEALFERYRDPQLSQKPPELEQRGGSHYSTAACELLASLYTDRQDIQVVNVRNNGTIRDLPAHVVIERNAVISRRGAAPLQAGALPLGIRGLVQSVKCYEELAIAAAVSGDANLALQALAAHPLVPSVTVAKQLWHDILTENRAYLPQYR